jgi:hypothetical protein
MLSLGPEFYFKGPQRHILFNLYKAQGETNAGQIDTTTSRTGISVAGQPGAVVPPGGAKVSKRNRVVSTGEDVAGTTKRKEPKPSAIGFRGANEQENKQDNANEVLELGNGARVLLVGNGDAFVKDATGKESGVIRQGDTRQGVFQSASELPAHVPEPIRQPLINYANALQQNYYLQVNQITFLFLMWLLLNGVLANSCQVFPQKILLARSSIQ